MVVSLNQPISILRGVCTSSYQNDAEETGGSEPQLGRPVLLEERRGKEQRNGPFQLRPSTLMRNLRKGNGTLVKLATYINGGHSSKASPRHPQPHHVDSYYGIVSVLYSVKTHSREENQQEITGFSIGSHY